MDEFAKFASGFDWIRPLICLAQDLLRDGVHLAVPGAAVGGPSRRDVRRALRKRRT